MWSIGCSMVSVLLLASQTSSSLISSSPYTTTTLANYRQYPNLANETPPLKSFFFGDRPLVAEAVQQLFWPYSDAELAPGSPNVSPGESSKLSSLSSEDDARSLPSAARSFFKTTAQFLKEGAAETKKELTGLGQTVVEVGKHTIAQGAAKIEDSAQAAAMVTARLTEKVRDTAQNVTSQALVEIGEKAQEMEAKFLGSAAQAAKKMEYQASAAFTRGEYAVEKTAEAIKSTKTVADTVKDLSSTKLSQVIGRAQKTAQLVRDELAEKAQDRLTAAEKVIKELGDQAKNSIEQTVTSALNADPILTKSSSSDNPLGKLMVSTEGGVFRSSIDGPKWLNDAMAPLLTMVGRPSSQANSSGAQLRQLKKQRVGKKSTKILSSSEFEDRLTSRGPPPLPEKTLQRSAIPPPNSFASVVDRHDNDGIY